MAEVKAVIFCDQVRTEDSGKLLIIGTYTGQMMVPTFPIHAQIQTVLVMGDMKDDMSLKVRFGSRGGATFFEFEAAVNRASAANDEGGAWLPMPAGPVVLSSPDTLELSVAIDDEPYKVVGVLPVGQQSVEAA
jgi:hypothetical protein